MIPELGHFALVLALVVAVVQGVVPMIGAWRGDIAWMSAGLSFISKIFCGKLIFEKTS